MHGVALSPLQAAAEPLVAERLSDRLAARLIRQIESGRLQPGERLPSEAQLAATHGVSRSVTGPRCVDPTATGSPERPA